MFRITLCIELAYPLVSLSIQQLTNYSSGFPTQHWFPQWFPLLSLCASKLLLPVFSSLSLSLSELWDRSLLCVFPSFMDPKRVIDFLVCSTFYLLRQSDYFHAPYKQNWKLEVPLVSFILKQFFGLLLTFTALKYSGQLFCRMFLSWV